MQTLGGADELAGRARETPDIETASSEYARRFSGEVGTWFLEVQKRIVLDLLRDLAPGSRILDVGGGHGQLAGPLADAGFDVTVTGSVSSCADRIRPLLNSGRARFIAGNLVSQPFPDDAFDAVVAFRLLPHLKAWRELIGELCRVSAGPVIVDYPSRRSFNFFADALFSVKKWVEENTRPYKVFAPTSIEAAFRVHGYRVVEERPEFVLPMVLYRGVDSRPIAEAVECMLARIGLTGVLGSPVVSRADSVA